MLSVIIHNRYLAHAVNNCHLLLWRYRRHRNVNLGTVVDQFVADLLKTGHNQSQVILREGLRLLKEREELKQLRLAGLGKEIAIDTKQARQGKVVDGEAVFAEIRQKSQDARRRRRS